MIRSMFCEKFSGACSLVFVVVFLRCGICIYVGVVRCVGVGVVVGSR